MTLNKRIFTLGAFFCSIVFVFLFFDSFRSFLSFTQTKSRQKLVQTMGVWQGLAIDSLKFHPGPPYPTLLRPARGPHLKRPNDCFRGGPPKGRAAYGCLLPF
jgi:hypothetical protein